MQTNTELKCEIGKRVHDFRIKNDYTQAQFAESIDISVNFLSEIENGKKGMSQETLYKLCQKFNISADYILFGDMALSSNTTIDVDNLISIANTFSVEDLDLLINYFSSLKNLKKSF